ncbi:MAG TPA: hypothetical protein VF974_05110 [Patescibacteria group bacterium]
MKRITLVIASVLLLASACNKPKNSVIQTPPSTPAVIVPAKQPMKEALPLPALHTVGQVTWHAGGFINQRVRVRGYLLKTEKGYILFSDESSGPITLHDLPVTGVGIENMKTKLKYELVGTFLDHGLTASNKSPNHLELETPSTQVK